MCENCRRLSDQVEDLSRLNEELQKKLQNQTAALVPPNDRLEFISQNMPALLEAFDHQRQFIVWNREAERVSGYKAEEIVGNPQAMELLYPDPEYRENQLREMVKRGHDFRDWEWQMTCKDGSVKTISWFNVSKHFPIPGWRSWAIGVDISERKKAEEALRESRELFRSAFNDSAVGMSIFDVQGRFLEVNARLCQLLGYTEPELLEKSVIDITHPEDQALTRRRMAERLEGKTPPPWLEKRYVHKDGREIWVGASSSLVYDREERPVYFVSHIQDLSERKRAEAALRVTQRQFSLFMNNLPGLAYIKDHTGKYLFANGYFEEIFHRPVRQIYGQTDSSLLPPEYLVQWQENEQKVLAEETPLAFTETTPGPDGPRYWLSSKFPIFQDQAPTLLGGISIDITYRVKTEQELETRRQELRLQAENLQALNTTLKVLLDQREQEKNQQLKDFLTTLERLVFPYLERLRATALDQNQRLFVDLLDANLKEISAPFAGRLSSLENKLTPMELEVADLLKRGKTTTEIASALHVSEATVSSHRSHIRDKLGLRHRKVNLKAYLRSMA